MLFLRPFKLLQYFVHAVCVREGGEQIHDIAEPGHASCVEIGCLFDERAEEVVEAERYSEDQDPVENLEHTAPCLELAYLPQDFVVLLCNLEVFFKKAS